MAPLLATADAPDPAVQGAVSVEIHTSASPDEVWRALAEPAHLGRWFGALDAPLRPGGRSRLDFGDGDFFNVETLGADPPRRLRYAWRFLGLGPREIITWEVEPDGEGSSVRVTDTALMRPREAAEPLRKGWLDFTGRLERFLSTGEDARYDWRRELDGSVELVGHPDRVRGAVLGPDAAAGWLPLDRPLADGAEWRLDDGQEPDAVRVAAARAEEDTLTFRLTHPSWAGSTGCRVQLHAHGWGSRLSFSHDGWEGISPDGAESLRQRRRFADAWVAALRRARERAG